MTTFSASSIPDMTGKTVIVTGANSGIGRAAATALADHGARVVLAVRNTDKGDAAASQMPGTTEVRRLDLASLASVKEFAAGWDGPDRHPHQQRRDHDPAAVAHRRRVRDAVRAPTTSGTSRSPTCCCPTSPAAWSPSSSTAHRMGQIDFSDLNWERKSYRAWRAYGQSKLANLLFTAELQRRLIDAGSAVEANAAHPGYAATNLQFHSENRLMEILCGSATA